jgi:hypothetical protein
VITADGGRGGYGGLPRKGWLLDHEQLCASAATTA